MTWPMPVYIYPHDNLDRDAYYSKGLEIESFQFVNVPHITTASGTTYTKLLSKRPGGLAPETIMHFFKKHEGKDIGSPSYA